MLLSVWSAGKDVALDKVAGACGDFMTKRISPRKNPRSQLPIISRVDK